MKNIFLIIYFFLGINLIFSQFDKNFHSKLPTDPPFLNLDNSFWVDSLLTEMTIEQKIAQSFFIAANSHSLEENDFFLNSVENTIKKHQVGGLIFFKSNPSKIIELVNRYQSISSIPLINSIDGEWGVSMRIDSTTLFPWAMTLGAVGDDNLLYEMGKEIANQCRFLGIHMNFAPVVDVNNNPKNPIIGRRSFGENPELVSNKALHYMRGLQDNGVLACIKHFPGHGDTDVDSHNKMPTLLHNRARLDSVELYPFNELIYRGISSVMMAHMSLPNIDSIKSPASLSSFMIKELLQKKLSFKGLVVTDALNMGGVKGSGQRGDVELSAYLAGNDILLYPENVSEGIEKIKNAYLNGLISEEDINNRCKKILLSKKWLGLNSSLNVFPSNNDLIEKLNSFNAERINRDLVKSSLVVLKNDNLLPLTNLNKKKVAYIHMGDDHGDYFYESLNRYFPIDKITYIRNEKEIIADLKNYDIIICGVHFKSSSPFNKYNLSKNKKIFLKKISKHKNSILTLFSSPYILNDLQVDNFKSIILSHQNNYYFQDLSAQLILGAFSSSGKMPISSGEYKFGSGLNTNSKNIISFGLPEEVGLSNKKLTKIDSIINFAIKIKAIPGAQILVAKDNLVVYNKCFGFHTYDSLRKVSNDDIYDLASLTKIIAAAPMFMNLTESSKISLNNSLGDFFNLPDSSDKKDLTFLDIFTHQAQLYPWIPFHNSYMGNNNKLTDSLFNAKKTELFSSKVANDLYFRTDFQDSIIDIILNKELLKKKQYKYSDLGFYLFHYLLENKLDIDIDSFLKKEIYEPIEAFRIMYNPIEEYLLKNIIPTENDKIFRKQLLHGFVHDPGAALFGGLGLHAGLFSNAVDLVKVLQLYLNEGSYNNQLLFKKNTIKTFTSSPFKENENRRGIFFDKPSLDPKKLNVYSGSSSLSYGHTGFTGTMAWVDPEEKLIYIFLSNRVFPNSDNWKLTQENIRTNVQQVIYESLIK